MKLVLLVEDIFKMKKLTLTLKHKKTTVISK